jgi:TolB-like protein/Tfp pilus assembly protein PilF
MAHTIRFDAYEVSLPAGQLRKHGVKIGLRGKAFQVLATLLEHPGEVVTREELCRQLWREEVFVDFDNNLNTLVATLREALGDTADHPRFIETLPKRGYRFLAQVDSVPSLPQHRVASRARLIVLPFANLTGDAAQEYFSDAITDEFITALACLAPEHLAVIARTTAMRYKGTHKDVAHIARELQVDYVVEGGVRITEDRISISVQLIQAADQTHLFAQKYDVRMRDIFSLYSCAALAFAQHLPTVADAMRSGLALREQVRRKPTEDLIAYNEYIKGRHEMWKMNAESLAEAKRHFEAALARDPTFALPCNALAELYWYLGILGLAPSRETDRLGRSYALRALGSDSTSAETHALLSFFPKKRTGDEIDYYDWAQIQGEVAHARQLDSNSRLVRIRYAMVLAILGDIEEAVAELERALESDPLSFDVRCWLTIFLHLGRHFDQALEQASGILDLEPERFLSYHISGYVYLAMGRFEESTAQFRKALELSQELPMVLGFLGLSLGLSGRTAEARIVLERLHALTGQRYVPPTSFAWTNLGIGNIDETFLWLERAIDAPDRFIEPIKTYPFLDPLRSDPRFITLLRKMNLEG